MAPAAELLVATGLMRSHNQALPLLLDWIESHPCVAGKPIVVNIRDGYNLGAHDGSSPLERRIERFLAPDPKKPDRPTRVVVKSAGNEATTNRHVRATVPAQGLTVLPLVTPKGGGEGRLEIWVPPSSGLEFELRVGSARTQRIDLTTKPIEEITLPSSALAWNLFLADAVLVVLSGRIIRLRECHLCYQVLAITHFAIKSYSKESTPRLRLCSHNLRSVPLWPPHSVPVPYY